MLFLIALVIAVLFSVLCAGALKKVPAAFYVGGVLVSVLMAVLAQQPVENVFLRKYVIGLFSRGALAGALWFVVMGMRLLPDGSKAIKRLMPVRGELSIFTAAVTLSHISVYGLSYIKRLTDPNFSKAADFVLTCAVCAALVLIMLPLTVISFKKIRKKMNAKKWKNIQRAAYVFYALIYLHVIILFVPKARAGIEGYFLSCVVYTAVFGAYLILRVRKWYVKKKSPESRAWLNIASTACAVLLTGIAAFCSYGKPQNRVRTQNRPARTVSVRRNVDAETTAENDRTAVRAAADDKNSSAAESSSAADSESSSESGSAAESSSSKKDSSSSSKSDSSSKDSSSGRMTLRKKNRKSRPKKSTSRQRNRHSRKNSRKLPKLPLKHSLPRLLPPRHSRPRPLRPSLSISTTTALMRTRLSDMTAIYMSQ
ncbi:FMN-binding protein [uncultured Ruminococcus sp.]|uniref:FMN-binding protein n=1 Tax=uncultured Ruminococcus sp. TaxID=165186 RepID=UPI0025FD0210|nr:FMN-binding protein [uncultured Ruminococcus sp.]